MSRCKTPGCGSYALNHDPASGLCDVCLYRGALMRACSEWDAWWGGASHVFFDATRMCEAMTAARRILDKTEGRYR